MMTGTIGRSEPEACRGGGNTSFGDKGIFGAVFSADWAPENTDADGSFGGNLDVSAHRFRLLIGPGFEARIGPELHFRGVLGIGADIMHVSAKATVGPATFESSDTDVGIAFEPGIGFWVNVGSGSDRRRGRASDRAPRSRGAGQQRYLAAVDEPTTST